MRFNHLLAAVALGACAAAQAQAPASPAKKELVQKVLALQQPGIELAARGLVERPAALMLPEAGRVAQVQVPADKREAVGKTIEADAKRYVEETFPQVRDRALKIAPVTLGAGLEEKFTEDELKQLIAWFESPLNKKFQAASGEMQNSFMQKLVAEVRPMIEPNLQALEQKVRAALGVPAASAGAAAKPAAKAPAKAASK